MSSTPISSIHSWLESHPLDASQYAPPYVQNQRLSWTLEGDVQANFTSQKRKRTTLGSISNNIASLRKKEASNRMPRDSKLTGSPERRSRRIQKQGDDEDLAGQIQWNESEDTPRSNVRFGSLAVLQQPFGSSRAPSPTRSSTSNTTRSSSPKKLGDLQFSGLLVDFIGTQELPPAVKAFVTGVKRTTISQRLIHISMKTLATSLLEFELDDYNFYETTEDPLLQPGGFTEAQVWERVREIHKHAGRCESQQQSEAGWKDKVHSRLFDLALDDSWLDTFGIGAMNLTSARIDNSIISTKTREGKMIDYGIYFQDRAHDKTVQNWILERLKSDSYQCINQTNAECVRFRPLGISIETKRAAINEDEAKVQLGIWVKAHFIRLLQLCRIGFQDVNLPVLPLIIVQGHDWRLKVARKHDCVAIYGDWELGSTRTVPGIYKLLKVIRQLALWVRDDYKPWFERNVFGVS